MDTKLAAVSISILAWFLLLTGCEEKVESFNLSIDNFYGVEGFTLHYDVSPGVFRVRLTDDFDSPEKHPWESELSSEQSKAIAILLEKLPLETLEDEYDNPNVDDGLQLTFRIRRGNESLRTIELRNRYQKDLFAIIEIINEIVPDDYAIRFDQGSVTVGDPEE